MKNKIWDFWAKHYDRLWVQKYSLGPTREKVKEIILGFNIEDEMNLLDIGCGTGELLYDLRKVNEIYSLYQEITDKDRLDYSFCSDDFEMIEESKKKNKNVTHYIMDVEKVDEIKDKFDIVTCTHSLPYYASQKSIIKKIHTILKKDGRAILAFASGNTLLDKLIMLFVKLTTGPASYPSDRQFKKLIDGLFEIELREEIKLKPYMPTIAVYSLKKVE